MKKIFKKSVAAVVAVTLVTSPVRADFFSDFCGAIFTILTFPIAAIAPDNPTLRKNNPFRKKLWQIEAEREEREEQILQRYSKQIPNAPVVAPVPASDSAPAQIPIGQITDIVIAEVQKRLPKKSEPQITIAQITAIVAAEVKKHKEHVPQNELIEIVRNEVKLQKLQVNFSEDDLARVIADELIKREALIVGAVQEKVEDTIEARIAQVSASKSGLVAPASDYICDIFIKGSALVVGNQIMHTVIFCVSGANPTGALSAMATSASQMYLFRQIISPQADRQIKRFKNVAYEKIIGPKPATWQETLMNVATLGGCIGLTVITFFVTKKIEARWAARVAFLAGEATILRLNKAGAATKAAEGEGEHVEGEDRVEDRPEVRTEPVEHEMPPQDQVHDA